MVVTGAWRGEHKWLPGGPGNARKTARKPQVLAPLQAKGNGRGFIVAQRRTRKHRPAWAGCGADLSRGRAPNKDGPVARARGDLPVLCDGKVADPVRVLVKREDRLARLQVPNFDLAVRTGRHAHVPPGRHTNPCQGRAIVSIQHQCRFGAVAEVPDAGSPVDGAGDKQAAQRAKRKGPHCVRVPGEDTDALWREGVPHTDCVVPCGGDKVPGVAWAPCSTAQPVSVALEGTNAFSCTKVQQMRRAVRGRRDGLSARDADVAHPSGVVGIREGLCAGADIPEADGAVKR